MKYIILFAIIQSFAFSQDLKSRLSTATTTEEIMKFSEKFEKFGKLQSALFDINEDQIFAIWTEPRGKQASATFIQAYYFNNGKWKIFVDEISVSKNISVMLDPVKRSIIFTSNREDRFLEKKISP